MKDNILVQIAEETRRRIESCKREVPESELRRRIEKNEYGVTAENTSVTAGEMIKARRPGFLEALIKPELSFICEVKKASPSKGVMVEDFRPLEIAEEYLSAGADALSVLTEPYRFLGKDEHLLDITQRIMLPALRKDFTVDPYMIYQAKMLNASAVLLIVAILEQRELKEYLKLAEELGLDALVETHSAEEIRRAEDAGAKIIGINNRDLRSFTTSIENSISLRHLIPKEAVFVSESGIHTPEDVKKLKECGADALLIGEAFVTSGDKAGILADMRKI